MTGTEESVLMRATIFLFAAMVLAGLTGCGSGGDAPISSVPGDIALPPINETVITIPPVDESDENASFARFLDQLRKDVAVRDVDAVAAVASAEIKLSFGGDYGRERFREWLDENPVFDDASYWEELDRVFKLGAVQEADGTFCMPYISCFDYTVCPDCDPFETLIAVTDAAAIHVAPDPGSEIVARLAYGVVYEIDTKHYPWHRVRAELKAGSAAPTNGEPPVVEGYVRDPDFRSMIDYRARFVRDADGDWQMTIFIAGD